MRPDVHELWPIRYPSPHALNLRPEHSKSASQSTIARLAGSAAKPQLPHFATCSALAILPGDDRPMATRFRTHLRAARSRKIIAIPRATAGRVQASDVEYHWVCFQGFSSHSRRALPASLHFGGLRNEQGRWVSAARAKRRPPQRPRACRMRVGKCPNHRCPRFQSSISGAEDRHRDSRPTLARCNKPAQCARCGTNARENSALRLREDILLQPRRPRRQRWPRPPPLAPFKRGGLPSAPSRAGEFGAQWPQARDRETFHPSCARRPRSICMKPRARVISKGPGTRPPAAAASKAVGSLVAMAMSNAVPSIMLRALRPPTAAVVLGGLRIGRAG